ncbi:hypothetical protein H257_06421 [Aphanomyces astaci]|uniref:Uncharacterized protein n=1 Tax=Aphanomyces astaci TaxID=112090 RepID=W4GMQ8_APHAT|nr:hypothetical protein H257_06421 [Aphanomyces astaci]ETV80985.1 hypothetical protein H257_06421 [Aphanomyces astaci]|eukprot:XP_009829932.1 hypothetical protein H257_06421 [Aphanomyces astaci]
MHCDENNSSTCQIVTRQRRNCKPSGTTHPPTRQTSMTMAMLLGDLSFCVLPSRGTISKDGSTATKGE